MPVESKAGNRITWNRSFFVPYLICPPQSPKGKDSFEFFTDVSFALTLAVAAQKQAAPRAATVKGAVAKTPNRR